MVSIECNGANFNTLSGDVFLLELTGNVSFYEGCFSDTTVSDEYDFELGYNLGSLHFNFKYYYSAGKNNTNLYLGKFSYKIYNSHVGSIY